jgi:hypothetical protein
LIRAKPLYIFARSRGDGAYVVKVWLTCSFAASKLLGKETAMESATFRRWLAERGCRFEAGSDTVHKGGHAYVTVRLGDRRAVLPEVGTQLRLDPRIVRQIVDELGLDWNELPGPASRV